MNRHPDLRPLLGDTEAGAGERARLIAHLAGCAACRAEVAAADPSLLFSLLAQDPIPEGVLDRVSRGVAAEIAAGPSRESRAIPGWALGLMAASVVVAGIFGAYLVTTGSGSEGPALLPPEPVRAASEPAVYPGAVPAGMIEVLDSPGDPDVVEMSVGDVEVVMIFDEAMKI